MDGLARARAARRVLVRAEPRDERHEQKRRVRRDHLLREPCGQVPHRAERAEPSARVLVLQVRRQRVDVLPQPPLAERVIQQELNERLRAQRPRFRGARAHDQRGDGLHDVVHLGQERSAREHGAHQGKRRVPVPFPLVGFEVAEAERHQEPELRLRGREPAVSLQKVVQKLHAVLRERVAGPRTRAHGRHHAPRQRACGDVERAEPHRRELRQAPRRERRRRGVRRAQAPDHQRHDTLQNRAPLLGQPSIGSGRSTPATLVVLGVLLFAVVLVVPVFAPSPLPADALLAGHLAQQRSEQAEREHDEDLEVGRHILGGPGERGDARGFLSADCLRVVVVVVAVLRLLVPVAGFRAGVLRDERIRAGGGELDQVPDACVRVRVRVDVSRRKREVNAPSNTRRTRARARERVVDAKKASRKSVPPNEAHRAHDNLQRSKRSARESRGE